MKNYFVIHALGRTENDYWYNFIKQNVENKGFKCFVPTLPPIEEMSYESWAKSFDKYKIFINEESVFVGHSTGSIFIVKYLMENNIKINKYISVVGFNKENTNSVNPLWDNINQSFFVENLEEFQKFANERIAFYSPTDVYDFNLLDDFATQIKANKQIIENAGHFTKGYETKFEEILTYL